MTRRFDNAGQRGFTLLEMLVALAVLGILVVGLTQGVRTGLTLWNAQARRVAEAANLDAAARTLRAILTAMQPPPSYSAVAEGETLPDNTYYADHLTFVSDFPSGLGGTQRVDLTLEVRQRRLVLRWTPHRHEMTRAAPAAPTETELVSAVDRLELTYWGRPSPEASAGWQQQWSGPGLPELIRVRLVFAKGDLRHWPVLIAAPLLWAKES